ncbi:MAG: bifunctional diaminohydroxyphosphoribosylaminopyrimidine deaminase/5-amino-6-(5-phosphoribosylamino)uracil reductase RibD [Thermaerobacter sp.]|nr:bifunctional diaminohydroxyphosphoribosylaminopyrimidine deaminase/5-amino-6-(5-phosphoribosylamino)uracil reductase RibD [Thermaerobacter sp.]
MSSPEDLRHMRSALDLATAADGRMSPNPRVGAVLVQNGEVVGRGWHRGPGTPHAEIEALREAKERARGATLYVTLEPCRHFGRTPPCTAALISAGVSRIVAAIEDPNPAEQGKGIAELRQAGIDVAVGLEAEAAEEMNRAYFTWRRTGRPMVTAKWAAALCGHAAARTGESLYITGPDARRTVHALRAAHDAVLVGIGTVLADDPQLTVRDAPGDHPVRVVLDSRLRTPPDARILTSPGTALICAAEDADPHRRAALEERGAQVLVFPSGPELPLADVLRELGRHDILSVLVEGGPTVLGRLFDEALVDRVSAFFAPLVLGGSDGLAAVGGVGAPRPAEGVRLRDVVWQQLGQDIYCSGTVERGR